MTWASDGRLARRLAWAGLGSAAAAWALFLASLVPAEPGAARMQVLAFAGLLAVVVATVAGVAAVVIGLRASPRDRVALGVAAVGLFLVAPFAALSVLLSGNLDV